jgi:uncharacterized protein
VRIPLFPLGTVLYPGLLLPLHVFEPRYRELVRDLMDLPTDAPRRFGVVAIREGREVGADGVRALYGVGCTAELRQVEARPDGRFDIATIGVDRFRLGPLEHSRAYAQADIEVLPEVRGPDAGVLAQVVDRLFHRYREAVLAGRGDAGRGEPPELASDPILLSYVVAAATVLDLPDKQALLEAASAADRLRLELRLLRREYAVLRRLPSLPAVDLARSGYGVN